MDENEVKEHEIYQYVNEEVYGHESALQKDTPP